MDRREHINNERTTIESMNDSIVSLILNEGKVVIPELGYLELVVFPDKRTVLFKAAENAVLFLASEGSIQSQIYKNISVPLKEGKVVNLPEVGIFHPIKKEDGSYRISYTISSSLRELLNGEKKGRKFDDKKSLIPVVEPTVKEQRVDRDEKGEMTVKEEVVKNTVEDNNAKAPENVVIPAPKEIRVDRKMPSYIRNTSKVGDIVVPQEEKNRNNLSKKRGIIAIAAALIALIFIVWYLLPESKNQKNNSLTSERLESGSNQVLSNTAKYNKSIDLPLLAEQKYGNRIFWVYIYEANRDKISSPVNIPAGTDIKIPNLWDDYRVDVMDSMEIIRAKMLSEDMLKRKI